jgi:hypothetical protein
MALSEKETQKLRERARPLTDDEVRSLLAVAQNFHGLTKRHVYDSIVYALAGSIPELRAACRETCAVIHMISCSYGRLPPHGDDG